MTAADDEAIVRCALDYFEGWFDGEALAQVTAGQMVEATAAGAGRKLDSDARRIDVRVVEIHGDIATAVVDSNVYREYLHLVRTEEGWRIANALWAYA